VRVLGISGSLRRDSHNTLLLRAAGELVEEHGAEFEVFDGLKAIPPYDQDDDIGDAPPAVAGLRQAIAGADAVLFATPEHNSQSPACSRTPSTGSPGRWQRIRSATNPSP
jgi:chromate reductase